jgi:hypothetical protein
VNIHPVFLANLCDFLHNSTRDNSLQILFNEIFCYLLQTCFDALKIPRALRLCEFESRLRHQDMAKPARLGSAPEPSFFQGASTILAAWGELGDLEVLPWLELGAEVPRGRTGSGGN